MTMTSTDAWVGGALRRVTNAVAIAELHGARSPELESLTRDNIEQAIQQALGHGFAVAAVADAASMSVEDVNAIAADEAA